MQQDDKIWLNLGCGHHIYPKPWINIDLATKTDKPPDIEADIRDLSMFPNDHADIIMAIHVIEHFYRWEVDPILAEWLRVLRPGGQLILECPDLRKIIYWFTKKSDNLSLTTWALYGNPHHKDKKMCHRWGYTPAMLTQIMEAVGFVDVQEEDPQTHYKELRDMRIVGKKRGN